MGIRKSVKKATSSAAGIAAATTGLSTCHDGGGIVVDPVPPPLVCSSVSTGQSFVMTATRDADVVTVRIRSSEYRAETWRVTRVGDVVGATVTSTTLPQNPADSLIVSLQLATHATIQVDFTVEGDMTSYPDITCSIRRTIHLTIGPTSVQVAESNLDQLPLRARNSAQIVIVDRFARTVYLEARTGFKGAVIATWEITAGTLSDVDRQSARWTLPAEPGLYQAEVLLDYGPDGLAFDALMLEVR